MKGVNDSEENLRLLSERAAEIRADEIHISLPERPPAEPWVEPAEAEGVPRAARILGGATKVLRPGEGVLALEDACDAFGKLVSVIGRHPLNEGQVMDALASFSSEKRASIIRSLDGSGQVKRVRRNGTIFWVSDSARFPEDKWI